MDLQTTALILAWVAIALLSFALAGVVRQLHTLQSGGRRIERAAAPSLIGDVAASLSDLAEPGRITSFVYLDTTCATCKRVLDDLELLASVRRDVTFKVLFAYDGPDAPTDFDVSTHMAEKLQAIGVVIRPSVVLVDADARVLMTDAFADVAQLGELIDSVTERAEP